MERDLAVQEVMDREYVGVSESDDLRDTVELMLGEGTESAVVLRGSDPVGVVTERDALQAFVESRGDVDDVTVADAMTDSVPSVSPGVPVGKAADQMSADATKHVIVTDGDEPLGVLSEHDLITTSPFAPAVGADHGYSGAESPDPARTAVDGPTGRANSGTGDETRREYEDQSICEACGTLSRGLSTFNGQLLCPDCRTI